MSKMSSVDARNGSVPIIPDSKVVRSTTTEGQHGPLDQIARFTHGLAAKIAGRLRHTTPSPTSTAEVDPIALHFTADRETINILPGSAPDTADATGVGREFVTHNPKLWEKGQGKAERDETNSSLADQMRTLAALPNPTPSLSNLNLYVMPPSDSSSPVEYQPRSLLMEPIVGILPTKDGARTVKGQKLSISDTNYQVQYHGGKTHLVSKEGDVTAQISYPDTNSSFTTYVQMEGRDGSQVWVKIDPDGAMQVLQNGKIEQKSLIHTHTLRPNQPFRAAVVSVESSEGITTSAIAHPQEIKPEEFVVEGRIQHVFCVTDLQANDAHRSASEMVELPATLEQPTSEPQDGNTLGDSRPFPLGQLLSVIYAKAHGDLDEVAQILRQMLPSQVLTDIVEAQRGEVPETAKNFGLPYDVVAKIAKWSPGHESLRTYTPISSWNNLVSSIGMGMFSNETGRNVEWYEVETVLSAFQENILRTADLTHEGDLDIFPIFEEGDEDNIPISQHPLSITARESQGEYELPNQEALFVACLGAQAQYYPGTNESPTISIILPTGDGTKADQLLLTVDQYRELVRNLLFNSTSGRRGKILRKYRGDFIHQTRGLGGSLDFGPDGLTRGSRRAVYLL